MDDIKTTISAAVLAGGQSRRMGTDKALVEFDGVPLLARAIETLRMVSDDVLVVGDRPAYHEFGARVVADAYPDTGTLGGIATALIHAQHDHVLVVACDMPLLQIDVLAGLAKEPRDYDVLVPALPNERSTQGGRLTYETLHAIYAKACLPAIEQRLRSNDLKVIGFFEDVVVRLVDEAWLRSLDPELLSFFNTNLPAELEEARSRGQAGRFESGKDQALERDYSKFLDEDGRLNPRLLPRAVYTLIVKDYRQREQVIAEVFHEHFWLWDLEESERKAKAEDREVSRADLAQKILSSMDDNDWWKVMSSFESHLQEHFRESPEDWAELLDPVYDDQESAGWTNRQ